MSNALDGRLRALEDEFFRQVDLKLSAQLRENTLREEARAKLANVVHIDDNEILDELLRHGVNDETVPVLLLIPLVFVAWSDGRITDAERETVTSIVTHYTPDQSPEVLRVVEKWLDHKPGDKLWDAWKAYIKALQKKSSPVVSTILNEKLLEHATRVAEASTSYLSLKRICAQKRQALTQLEAALKE